LIPVGSSPLSPDRLGSRQVGSQLTAASLTVDTALAAELGDPWPER
jgi:hypothetical protein